MEVGRGAKPRHNYLIDIRTECGTLAPLSLTAPRLSAVAAAPHEEEAGYARVPIPAGVRTPSLSSCSTASRPPHATWFHPSQCGASIDLHLNWFTSRPSGARIPGLSCKLTLVNLNKSSLGSNDKQVEDIKMFRPQFETFLRCLLTRA